MTTVTTEMYETRFEISSGNGGNGAWKHQTTVGPQSEAAARKFYDEAVANPLMRNIELARVRDGEVIARHA